jgi:aminoglycoside phosphotransferase (APT) family kinase protein
MERLEDTEVPAPVPVHYCADDSLLGDAFLVMTHLDGEPVAWDEPLPERFRHPEARRALGETLADVAAAIHSLDTDRVADGCTPRSPTDQVERALDRLDDATSVTGHAVPRLRELGDWLLANAPDEAARRLVHGDLQPYNVLFTGEDVPEIAGVLDWEAAFLGDPGTELGYLLLSWREPDDPPVDLSVIAERHGEGGAGDHVRERDRRGLFPWTTAAGPPSRRALVDRWESATGRSFERDRYFRAQAAFLLATVWADVYRDRVDAAGAYDWRPHVEWAGLLGHRIADGDVPL